MEWNLMNLNQGLATTQAVQNLLKCNEFTGRYGLLLSPEGAIALLEQRGRALSTSRRVEFGGGAVEKLIRAFCDSPYLSQNEYVDQMEEIIAIFYEFKNETQDRMTDDALIAFMVKAFNGPCAGSLELLEERELVRMAQNLRCRGQAVEETEELEEEIDGVS